MTTRRVVSSMTALRQRSQAILRRVGSTPRCVEVGIFIGRLSAALLRGHRNLHLTMVDNWLPTEAQPSAYKETTDFHAVLSGSRQRAYRASALRETQRFADRRNVVELASVEAAATFPDSNFDLVFIDADHSHPGCAADIAAWWPKVVPGGWLSGHDYKRNHKLRGVEAAVDEFMATNPNLVLELDEDCTWFVRKP